MAIPLRQAAPAVTSQAVAQQIYQQPAPIRKYNISYGNNGEIYYNGANIGNYYTSNIFEVGEDRFVENWAKENNFELQPNNEWIDQYNQNRIPLRKEERDSDVSEQGMMQTFGVSDAQRNTAKPGAEMSFNAPAGMQPLTQFTATKGMDQPINQNVDTQQYGKGFAAENLNPFFRK